MDKGKAAPRQKSMHCVWADAQTGIDHKVVEERKTTGQCTRCTLTNHEWKHCQKEILVRTIQRKLFKLLGGRLKHPYRRKPRVAAMAEESCGKTWQQASQRQLALTFKEDEAL